MSNGKRANPNLRSKRPVEPGPSFTVMPDDATAVVYRTIQQPVFIVPAGYEKFGNALEGEVVESHDEPLPE